MTGNLRTTKTPAISAPLRETMLIASSRDDDLWKQKRQNFWTLAAATYARKKSSQKQTRPRGAKDVVTFPGAIGRNNACVRADLQQVALGGRKRLPRVGECIVADGGLPCQRQPLRGFSAPMRGDNPSTWFVGLRTACSNLYEQCSTMRRSQKKF
jgi:hypothetical protein